MDIYIFMLARGSTSNALLRHEITLFTLMSFSRFVWPAERSLMHQCKAESFVYKLCMQHFLLAFTVCLVLWVEWTYFSWYNIPHQWGELYHMVGQDVSTSLAIVSRSKSILTYSIIRLVKYKQQFPFRLHRNSKVTKNGCIKVGFWPRYVNRVLCRII